MLKSKRINYVLLLSVTLFLGAVAVIEFLALRHNNWVMCYPLDDTFIHMEVARNFEQSGVWGISPYEFGSASSSLFYTLLLALLFWISSPHVVIPLLVNCVAGVFLLVTVDRWLRKQLLTSRHRIIVHLLLLLLIPLPVLAITGMEHMLQLLFSFLFIYSFAEWLESVPVGQRSRLPVKLFIYAILVTTIRFEGMFLVALVCLTLLLRKRLLLAIALGTASILPIITFGIYSVSKGSYFLPNSVLMKSQGLQFSVAGITELIKKIFTEKLVSINEVVLARGEFSPGISLPATQMLLLIIPAIYLFTRKYLSAKPSYTWLFIVTLGAVIIHLSLAATGWLYRYEAYLFLLSIPVLAVTFIKALPGLLSRMLLPERAVALFFSLILLLPIVARSGAALSKPVRAINNIYEQQYQMATFMHRYYINERIAFNDIGAVSFFTDGHSLDLWGLGDIDVARSKREKRNTPEFLDSLVKREGVRFAIVYDDWFSDSLLSKWQKVATWKIQDNVICGSDTVSFYSVDPSITTRLLADLKAFQPSLPATVQTKYYQ